MKTKIINLFGGPGVGKSSTAYMLAGYMKWNQINCELVTEYAKEVVWENRIHLLENQFYISAKQYKRLDSLIGKVDYIITDSPLLLGALYGKGVSETLKNYLLELHNKFYNINFYLGRGEVYLNEGRLQTFEEAKEIDRNLKEFLNENKVECCNLNGNIESYIRIFDHLKIWSYLSV